MSALRISVGLVVKPLIKGFLFSSAMTFSSAPSANSLTLSVGMLHLRQYSLARFLQRFHADVRLLRHWLCVIVIYQNRPATRGPTRADVAPAIANHVRATQI